ncbi:MAG TPA: SGNH/GDSL hydrolase family protein [Planctomycetota bacterium]|nr:SGNH/GDSL hydrolase family protein [Planctomycetota bacterium]
MLERTSQRLARGERIHVVSYGDSISNVGRQPDYHGGASCAEMNWAYQLQRLLAAEFPGANFVIKPFGVGGQNAYEGLGRFPWLAELDPDLVLIALGGNDCGWHEIPPYCSAHAVRTLALGVRHDFGADVVILGPAGDCPTAKQTVHLDETIDALRGVARDIVAPFVDIRAAMLRATDNGRLYADFHQSLTDNHPNDRGHGMWAAAVFETLKTHIRRG